VNNLSTDVLRLEPVRDSQINILRAWESDSSFKCVFPFAPWPTTGKLESFLRGSEAFRALMLSGLDASDVLFGWAAFAHLDWKNRSVSLMWGLHGIAPKDTELEVARALVKFAFDELNLLRLEVEILTSASSTIQILEQLGFNREVLKLEAASVSKRFEDVLVYGLLRDVQTELEIIYLP
jgi:[ribosomal protein S5]-alanine N-acetyltransferase